MLSGMIRSFKDAATARLFADEDVPRFRAIERQARRRLMLLDGAGSRNDLRQPPGNRLEALKGDRHGQHSIRIIDQWRICFIWRAGGAEDVEIVDYH
jgi:proteic killer suppression protein